jgi:peptide/nickel transport system ATP-binding protein
LLEISDFDLTFRTLDGPVDVLKGLNMTIGLSERVALVGESGSGKSVTARVIMGLLPRKRLQTRGKILFDGTDVLRESEAQSRTRRGRDITMIFQDPMATLNPVYSIRTQFTAVLQRAIGRRGKELAPVMREALSKVSIADPDRVLDSYSFQLSGGLNQRVLIAMALAGSPRLLIADEPGTALDVTVQQQTLNVMDSLTQSSGTAILFISHNLGVVRNFAHRVCVMYAGRVVEQASTEDLFATPRHPYTRALIASLPRIASSELPEAIEGSVPSLNEVPEGCPFAPRCRYVEPRCRTGEIPMNYRGSHGVACIRAEEIA